MNYKLAAVIAILSGAITTFAFAPYQAWMLAIFTPAILLHILCNTTHSTKHRVFLGWLFGVGLFSSGIFWIHESFKFSHVHISIAILLTILLICFLALYYALLVYVWHKISLKIALKIGPNMDSAIHAQTISLLLIFPATWVISEWLRDRLFTGFGWLQLGYSQVDGLFQSFIPVIGVLGVSGLLVVISGCLTILGMQYKRLGLKLGIALVVICGCSLALQKASWTEGADTPLSVAIIQGNIPQDIKWDNNTLDETLKFYVAETRKHLPADLVVWPETAVPSYTSAMRPFLDLLDEKIGAEKSNLLLGILELNNTGGAYNSAVLLGLDEGSYRKSHLVPFGEYLPFASILGKIASAMSAPISAIQPYRNPQNHLQVNGYDFASFICYEIAFSYEARKWLPQAKFLVTISNDAWFGNSIGPHQHFQMARARAQETGRWLVRATNTGISAIVNERGKTVAKLDQFTAGSLRASIFPHSGSTPFVIYGDWLVLILSLAILLASLLFLKPKSIKS